MVNTAVSETTFIKRTYSKKFFWGLGFLIVTLLCIVHMQFTHNIIHVSGESMMPTLQNDCYVIARPYYLFETIKAGDIVIADIGEVLIVKRVMAIEGDYISIETNRVYVNDELIQTTREARNYVQDIHLEANQYILLGDNAEVSRDSRNIQDTITDGIFTSEHIIAKVVLY